MREDKEVLSIEEERKRTFIGRSEKKLKEIGRLGKEVVEKGKTIM